MSDEIEVELTQEEINALIGALDVTGSEEDVMLQRMAKEIGAGPDQAAVVLDTLFAKLYELYEHPDNFAGVDRDLKNLSFPQVEDVAEEI